MADLIDLTQLPWLPHPTIVGIETKLYKNEAAYAPADVLIARVSVGQEIPWHVHERESEIAYLIEGRAVLHIAESEQRQQITSYEIRPGMALIVPPATWHSLVNTGDSEILIFALHT